MLDSSVGKILSTKSVEPSISSNVDINIVPSATPAIDDAPIITTLTSPTRPTRAEAEVRLVVRFLVEEHIVFNGKVEQIKHLDKTELSRIVSRIAWDGAKEESRPALEDKGIVDNVANTGWLTENSELNNCCEPTIEISPPQSDPPSANKTNIELIRPIEVGSTNIIEEPSCLTSNDTSSSPDETVPNKNEDGTTLNDTHQSNDTSDNNNPECDIKTTAFKSTDICEKIDPKTESSYNIRDESNHQQPQDDKDETDQLIVDTINDCVLNVDLESRRNEQLQNGSVDTGGIYQEEIEEVEHDLTERLEQVETTDINEFKRTRNEETGNGIQGVDIDMKPSDDAPNKPPNNLSNYQTIPHDSDVNHLREKDAQTNEAGKNDLNSKMVPNKKTDNSSSSRRRNASDNGPASKRIRRVSSKDLQQNHRVASRVSESLIDRKAINTGLVVEDEGGYFVRHSKILAKWSDNYFYSGTISKQKGDRKYEVIFYDGARKDVPETDLIPVCNILGKQVRITIAEGYCVNAIVLDQILSNGQHMFDVEYQQNGVVKKRVPLVDIFLTAEQGIPLINQPIKPDKNPDESMFAGVDLDNIVHVKRSRRLQEMEDFESTEEPLGNTSTTLNGNGGRRKRGQYNMRNITNRVGSSNSKAEKVVACERVKRTLSDVNNQDTPASSCSPDTLKTNLDSSSSNSPSESSSSREANKF